MNSYNEYTANKNLQFFAIENLAFYLLLLCEGIQVQLH